MSYSQEPARSSIPSAFDHVLIIHEVADYAAWKQVFDAAVPLRRTAGERSFQLLRDRENANLIVHFSAWSSHADAMRFFQSPELQEIRRQAGVKAPDFIYLNQLESGVL